MIWFMSNVSVRCSKWKRNPTIDVRWIRGIKKENGSFANKKIEKSSKISY